MFYLSTIIRIKNKDLLELGFRHHCIPAHVQVNELPVQIVADLLQLLLLVVRRRGLDCLAEQIAAVDSRNPITASRMAKVFSRCASYGPERQTVMRQAIDQLAAKPLSANTAEVVCMSALLCTCVHVCCTPTQVCVRYERKVCARGSRVCVQVPAQTCTRLRYRAYQLRLSAHELC